MNTPLLGVPWPIWGIVCLVLGTVYLVIWPRPRTTARPVRRPAWRHFILRWFHALVWLLLALACFIQAGWLPGGPIIATAIALLSLPAYAIFVATLLLERRIQR